MNQLTRNNLVKKHFVLLFFGILLSFSIGYYVWVSEQLINKVTSIDWFLLGVLGISLSYLNEFLSRIMDRKISWKKHEGTRILVGIIVHFTVSILCSYIGVYIYGKIVGNDIRTFKEEELLWIKLGILLLISSVIFQVIYFVFYSYHSYSTLQIEKLKLERKQITYQIKALKSQLSPHFLFNGLNTISSLIHKDVSKASLFIRKLAVMYNSILKSYDSKLITLESEIELVKSYVFLINTRFENKFNCEIEVSQNLLSTEIPPLTLQMLVENAVKHNAMSNEVPLLISIKNDKEYIYVKNNVTTIPKQVSSFKIGLKNINMRYLLLFGKEIIVSNGSSFIVKLPIVR